MLNQTVRRKDESEEAWQARQTKAVADINSHSLVLFHGLVQVHTVVHTACISAGTYAIQHVRPSPACGTAMQTCST